MTKKNITKLSREQEAYLLKYIAKWKVIALSTRPLDKTKAEAAIKDIYQESSYPEPEIVFFSSPFGAIKKSLETQDFKTYLGSNIQLKVRKRVFDHLSHLIKNQLDESFFYKLFNQISYPGYPNCFDNNIPQSFHFPMGIESCVETQLLKDFSRFEADYSETKFWEISKLAQALVKPSGWSNWGCMFDFCISVLGLQYDRQKWQVLERLMQYCDFIFQFENVCLVCDRPNKLLCDRQNMLHAEWEYALQFIDGYGVYAYHGGERPEGKRCNNDEYIAPGTRVRLTSTGEYGIVTHCWYSSEIYDFDCYVAFYGSSFPDEKTDCRPYILRYAAVSLEILE